MRTSIRLKLGLIIGGLLGAFLVLGFIAYNGIQTIHAQIIQVVEVEQPTSAVAYEMDVNLLRMVVGVLGYLGERDASSLNRIRLGRENFTRFRQEYSTLAETEKGNALGERAQRMFEEFDNLATALITTDDAQHRKTEILLEVVDAWETLLEEKIEAAITPETAQAYEKLDVVSTMERNLDEAQRFVGDYISTHDPLYKQRIQDRWKTFKQAFARYRQLTLSDQEGQWVQHLDDLFEETKTLSQDILALEDENIANLTEFLRLRRELGNTVLYQGIIKEIAEPDLEASEQAALLAVTDANRHITILLSLGVLFGVMFGILLSRSITRPLQQVVRAASRIAVGDLAVRLDVTSRDELGLLADSFRQMITYIKQVAGVAETIANGDLQVNVEPKSDQDVLNHSLRNMVTYIQDVSNVTEKISNKELQVEVQPKSDQDILNHSLNQMIANLKVMIQEIEQQNWLQNGLNQLNNELLGEPSLVEVCNKALRFVSRYTQAGYGVLYIYDSEEASARLFSSFAFTEREKVSNVYHLGEGVVGQVALERKPILLKNIRRDERLIRTGTTSRPPLNTYTFPLIYD
ncbi:HAMP domain-containing protein, partial [candidate division KSB3 bacterium]|nr:HAMP domain-containing protein [candidate division KSB3 bacterium]MBD3327219.1 HAMP domain-containing protein [candidate division KSB3 bacterium]